MDYFAKSIVIIILSWEGLCILFLPLFSVVLLLCFYFLGCSQFPANLHEFSRFTLTPRRAIAEAPRLFIRLGLHTYTGS